MKIEADSQTQLDRRVAIGDRCIAVAHEGLNTDAYYLDNEEDRQTYAVDALADILTAIVGPAGHCSVDGRISYSAAAIDQACELAMKAVESWKGDAEDYVIETDA